MTGPLAVLRVCAIVAVALLLTGCGGGPSVDPDLTVEQAKADTQRLETQVAEAFPVDLVDHVEQMENGTLLRCGDGVWRWSGWTRVYLTEPSLSDQVLRDIAVQFDDSEFAVVDGEPEAYIYGPEGQRVMVSHDEAGRFASIVSGSACFKLRDDQWPGDEY